MMNCSEGLSPSRKSYVGPSLHINLSCYLGGAELQNLKWHSSQCRIEVNKIGGDRPAKTIAVYWDVYQASKRPSQGFGGNRGKRAFISMEQGNKGQILRGTGEQKQYLGTGDIRKQIFDFGTRGTRQFISGEQGNRYPPGRASSKQIKTILSG